MIGHQRQVDELKKKYPVVDLFFKVEQADILPRFLEDRWTPIAGEGCVDFAELGAPRTIGVGGALPVLPMPNVAAPDSDDAPALPQASEAIPTTDLVGLRGGTPITIGPHGAMSHSGAMSHEAMSHEAMSVNFRPGARELHYPTAAQVGLPSRGPTAWLPIILGCNKVCSYCIVPSRRGRERSRPIAELLVEARELVDRGAREVTLLGQTVEAYGLDLPDQHADLGDLMERLSEIEGLARIRFMTSYPRHMTDKMIQQMAALPKVCEHVNIPVQHGDDAMLTRMRRGYTLGEYRELIGKLRAWWPGVSLSTDVIVGFCGETEEEFQHTLDLIEEVRFDVVHVAAYSPRPGTLSFKWEDDVPLEEKKRRLHAVEQVQERIALELNAPYVGRTEEVLIESHQVAGGKHQWRGRTRTNKLVFFPATKPDSSASPRRGEDRAERPLGAVSTAGPSTHVREGSLVPVHIEKTTAWSLQGRLATQ
jgi:tRNA-2-methylthio-N6-dimethylallyladenosine synthase